MPFANNQRITRRRSSAGPTPPKRPIGNHSEFNGKGSRSKAYFLDTERSWESFCR